MRLNFQILTVESWVKCFSSLLLLWGSNALGTIDPQTVTVQNASYWKRPAIQSTTPGTGGGSSGTLEIYGGIMGDGSMCTGTGTCDNCVTISTPCNAKRITPNTELVITFRTDNASVITGPANIFLLVDTTNKVTPISTSSVIAVNTDLQLTVKWGDLCAAINNDRNCSTPFARESVQFGISSDLNDTLEESLTIQVSVLGDATGGGGVYQYVTPCSPLHGVNPSNMGLCWVQLERGDEKVYISSELYYGTDFNKPTYGGEFTALHVYYTEGLDGDSTTFSSVLSSAFSSKTLKVKDLTYTVNNDDGVPTLNENKITGLTNGTRYYFMFASVDIAENVLYFSKYIDSISDPKDYLKYDNHSMVPEEVSGALEGKECFIATAAYGSPMAPQLEILRTFRDQFLKTNALGRWFVKKYYIYGPKWAKKIKQRDSVRAAVRTALSPVVSVAQWMILYGLKSFILISLMGFIIGFFIIRRVIRDHE